MYSNEIEKMRQAFNTNLPLESLVAMFPSEWQEVDQLLNAVLSTNDPNKVSMFMTKTKQSMTYWQEHLRSGNGQSAALEKSLPPLIRGRMTFAAMSDRLHGMLAAQDRKAQPGLSRYNQFLADKVLRFGKVKSFPSSALWWRLCWRLVTQKGTLISMLKRGGTYCVFTDEFTRRLAALLGAMPVIEIGAGDGTLGRFLEIRGINITCTDDLSWGHQIQFGKNVTKLSAKAALDHYQPTQVLCSWPPPNNAFESAVFATASVKTYVVIGSRHRFATSNREAYLQAKEQFDVVEAPGLARYLFPPELDSEVLIFRRRESLDPRSAASGHNDGAHDTRSQTH